MITNNEVINKVTALVQIFPDYSAGMPKASELDKGTIIKLVQQFPKYLAPGIIAQAHNTKSRPYLERQELCFAATVASFQLYTDRHCIASPDAILSKYNTIAEKFAVKVIKLSSLEKIQRRCTAFKNLVTLSYSAYRKDNTTERKLAVNLSALFNTLRPAMISAAHNAGCMFNRFLRMGGLEFERARKASNTKGLEGGAEKENYSRIKNIKENKNKKRASDISFDFYQERFFADAKEVQQLHYMAEQAKQYDNDYKQFHFSASNAFRLIQLHNKHNVKLGIKSFCEWIIHDGKRRVLNNNKMQYSAPQKQIKPFQQKEQQHSAPQSQKKKEITCLDDEYKFLKMLPLELKKARIKYLGLDIDSLPVECRF